MMKRLVVLLAVLNLNVARGQDLESIFSQGQTTQTTRNSSYLADVLRGILRTPTPEQNYFLRLIEESNWSEALLQYKTAFGQESFSTTDDGKALKALLMFKSGLTVVALENLFEVKDPKKIHFQILNQWRESAASQSPAWQVSQLNWKKEWAELFGIAIEVRVKAARLAFTNSIKELNELAMVAAPDSRERALLDWNLAIQYGVLNETKKAAMIVNGLMKAKNNPVPEDLVTITAARLLYQSGFFEAAEKYYEKIGKSSDYYLEAQEEKAWSLLRRRRPQDALAITQSLVHPTFSGQVGPETWFVRSLAQLKICDYPQALETLKGFPKEFKDRAIYLEALSKDANKKEVVEALNQIHDNKLNLISMAQISKSLPRTMVRDEKLRQLVKAQKLLETEAATAGKIFAQSLRGNGLQGDFEALKNSLHQRQQSAQSLVFSRVQEIAEGETKEVRHILNKLHIVEAEIIQQVEAAPKLVKNLKSNVEDKKGQPQIVAEDSLQFPFQKEFWFDELTNYKVDIKKACQARSSL